MAATLDFFGGFAVDMSDPASLYGGNVLADFSTGIFYGDEADFGDGAVAPLTLLDEAWDDEVRLWGSGFTYDEFGVTGGMVEQIEVYNTADLATNYSLPDTYRMTLTFGQPAPIADVVDALLAYDLSPLYAGQALTVLGDDLGDTLVGGTRGDELLAFGGMDVLQGRGGNDTLAGGAGADVLRGGSGRDAFLLGSPNSSSADTVLDLRPAEGDTIGLDGEVLSGLGAGGRLPGWKFHAADDIGAHGGGTGVAPGDRILYDTDSGRLYYDANGSAAGGRVLLATVFDTGSHPPGLDAADFRVL